MHKQFVHGIFFSMFLASIALGQNFFGVRALSMGSAYRAVATGNDAMFFNPAGMPFTRRFSFDADYLYHTTSIGHWTGLSLVDSVTNELAVGLDFHMGIDARTSPYPIRYMGTLALAYPISDVMAIGMLMRYATQVTGDVGLMIRLPFGLSLAAVGYNLIPTRSPDSPISVGFGTALSIGGVNDRTAQLSDMSKGFTLAFDWLLRDLSSTNGIGHQLSVGGEYYLFNLVPVRAGYTWQKETESILSAGLGLFLNVVEIDAVFQQNFYSLADRRFGGAVRLFFP